MSSVTNTTNSRLINHVGNVPQNRAQKRSLEVRDNVSNINNGTNKNEIKKKRKRPTNSLIATVQQVQSEENIAAHTARPAKRARRGVSGVTNFDKFRANQLAGLYMPLEYVSTIVEDFENDHDDKRAPNYFKNTQTDIKPRMRTILCGWLTEVVVKFEMKEIVLWQTFQIIDRYLAIAAIKREDFQLLGCAAMWVASKFHEIYPPVSADLVHMSDGAFTKEELIRMEESLCDKLGYDFTKKTALQYLDRYTNIAIHYFSKDAHELLDKHMAEDPTNTSVSSIVKKTKRIKFLARYALERYNLSADSVGRPIKHMAAMAIYTALSLTSNSWNNDLVEATGLTELDLRADDFIGGSFRDFKNVVLDFSCEQHKAVIRKYKRQECGGVSTLRKKARR